MEEGGERDTDCYLFFPVDTLGENTHNNLSSELTGDSQLPSPFSLSTNRRDEWFLVMKGSLRSP